MADVRLPSGKPIDLDWSRVHSTLDLRRRTSEKLGKPTECIRLVSSRGVELNDEDPRSSFNASVTTAVVDHEKYQQVLEKEFATVCQAANFNELLNAQTLYIGERQLPNAAPPQYTGCPRSMLWSRKPTVLPERLGELTQVEIFYCDKNELAVLPESFCRLASLWHLDLQNNSLTFLPENFGQLRSLDTIDIMNNQLLALPESFCRLPALQKVNLEHNHLRAIPEDFGQLTGLISLGLSHNQLTRLPESIGRLVTLEKLALDCNQLHELPSSITHLRHLRELHLEQNQLTVLPERLGQLAALEVLMLAQNQLIGLPDSADQLKCLYKLRLHKNHLTALPVVVLSLVALESITLSSNQFRLSSLWLDHTTQCAWCLFALMSGEFEAKICTFCLAAVSMMKVKTKTGAVAVFAVVVMVLYHFRDAVFHYIIGQIVILAFASTMWTLVRVIPAFYALPYDIKVKTSVAVFAVVAMVSFYFRDATFPFTIEITKDRMIIDTK